MKKFIITAMTFFLFANLSQSQGCIMVRNISGFGQYNFSDNAFSVSNWQLNITNRYFKSFRDFKGTKDINTVPDSMNINRTYTLDISVTRFMQKGWSLNFNLPVASNSRSGKLEHGGISNPEHTTRSFGIGDFRFTINKWIIQPTVTQKMNVQIGLGIKLPTGDYKYQDYFYRKEDSAVLAPVNPSIQLGDGGTGIITELNTFYVFNKTFSLYGNFYYLINPREQNGTSNLLGRIPATPALIKQVRAGGSINSVPDQYSIRAGAYFNWNKFLSLSAGLRHEGIPVYDLIGGSNGNRRAGHNTSVDPGILYKIKKVTVYVYVPIIVSRKIKQSVPDKKETENDPLHVYVLRQGGFANYLIFAGASFKL